jgi:hypothetical protein
MGSRPHAVRHEAPSALVRIVPMAAVTFPQICQGLIYRVRQYLTNICF